MTDAPLRGVLRSLSRLVSARQLGGLSDFVLLQRFVAGRDEAAFGTVSQPPPEGAEQT